MALSNKILAYFQAALYIVTTNTPAQRDFIEQHPLHGILTEQTSSSMHDTLNKIYASKEQIRVESKLRFTNASLSSWEKNQK